jgi:hypothetical protein
MHKKTKIACDRYARIYLLLSMDDRERERKKIRENIWADDV